jgi:lysophospholipase L1-like esterase
MTRRSWLVALAVLLAVALPQPAAAAPEPLDYVALGDSYAAGLGSSGAAGWCGRSPRSYPRQWVAAHPVRSFAFDACNAATTTDLRLSQLSHLDSGTDLVTVTIGGNDAGFAPAVATCVLADDAGCLGAVRLARDVIAHVLPGLLDAAYADIRRRAPRATVVVVGYPRLFGGGPCPGQGLSEAERAGLDAGADDLAGVVADRARAAGFTWVDVRPAFAGHGACGSDPWINGLSAHRLIDSFHPNDAGYTRGYLPAVTAAT